MTMSEGPGGPVGRPPTRRWPLGLVVVALAGWLGYAVIGLALPPAVPEPPPAVYVPPTPEPPDPKLTIAPGWRWIPDGGGSTIHGVLRNGSRRRITACYLTSRFYDAAGRQIDAQSQVVYLPIAPGATLRFKQNHDYTAGSKTATLELTGVYYAD